MFGPDDPLPPTAGAGLCNLAVPSWPGTRFLSLLGWFGVLLRVLSCRPPALVPGHGLGNRAALLRHGTICSFRVRFIFVLATHPLGAGGRYG